MRAAEAKHLEFARLYFQLGNAEQSAIQAGYRPSNARSQGSKLLKMPEVQAELERIRSEMSTTLAQARGEIFEETIVDCSRILQEYSAIAFAKFDDVAKVGADGMELRSDISNEALRAIESIDYIVQEGEAGTRTALRIKMHSKIQALDRLAKYMGLLDDLNVARAAFKKYGYAETVTETGYEYKEA